MRKYLNVFMINFQSSLEYRGNFLFGLFSVFLPAGIQFFLWTAIFTSANNPLVFGYSYNQMISYTLFSTITTRFIMSGTGLEIAEDIKNGKFSLDLIKPFNYFLYRILSYLGKQIVLIVLSIVLLAVSFVFLKESIGFDSTYFQFVVFIPALFLSTLLYFITNYLISAMAFWVVEVWHFFYAMNYFLMIFSGGIFPLDIFGDKLTFIMKILPFQYIIYFPVRVLTGQIKGLIVFQGLFMQIIWLLLLYLFSSFVWTSGYKKYVAVGG